MRKTWPELAGFEEGRRYESKSVGILKKIKMMRTKQNKTDYFPDPPERNPAITTPCETRFGFLTSRTATR